MANIELDGANKTLKVDSGNLTLDIPGDIILDADGANVTFKDGGTSVLDISNSSTDAVLTVSTQDKDLIIKGDDGGAAITAATFDMSDAGTLILNNDLELGTDSSVIKFGNDNEVTLTHVADKGLALKHTATADDKPIILTLQTGETDIAANDVIGAINFQAPDEGTGTDAILVAAGIEAVSEGDFSSSSNATKLSFKTGASEAAAEKMSLSSAGLLTIADDLVIKDGGTIGVSSDADSITIASNGAVTFSQTPVFPDGSIAVADLDIDGATDIGAAIVDADLFIIDDGAGGTNRKTAASRLKTYIGGGIDCDADAWARVAPVTDQDSAAVIDWATSIHMGSNISESGGVITVGTAGWYLVTFHISNQSAYSDNMNMYLRKNDTRQLGTIYWEGNTEINYLGMEATVLVECSANDTLDVYGTGYYTGNTNNQSLTWFTGVRLGA